MIVYADRKRSIAPGSAVQRLRALARSTDPDDLVEGLITASELETGVTDAWWPDRDDLDPRLGPLRATTLSFARALVDAWDGRNPRPVVVQLDADRYPERIEVATPEGTSFYALYPEAYAEAARRFARDQQPGPVVVVGLRSIGTALSAVVHTALHDLGWDVSSHTVRPRGHPFDRAPALGPALARAVVAPTVLVVDEGPGLSGSSLCGTAGALAALGVPEDGIVLVPSWLPDGSRFASEAARSRWSRHLKVPADSGAVVERLVGGGADWSAGKWREALGVWPAVDPRHERVKRRRGPSLARFVGLGAHGRAAVRRAVALADAGLGPPLRTGGRGFLHEQRLAGVPLDRSADRSLLVPAVLARLRHAQQRVTDRPVPKDALVEMVHTNLGEAGLPRPPFELAPPDDVPTVEIDGRMMAHEWLLTGSGVFKTDGFDHCEDHFFPGFQDLAWDVAGAAIELGSDVRDAVLAGLADPRLPARVPWYEVAYAAFRLGYATMAHEATDRDERERWASEIARYSYAAKRAVGALR